MGPELFSRYRLIGILGEGTYGVVYKCKKLDNGGHDEPGEYAIKMIKRSKNEIERPSVTSISTLREIKLLRELTHENIVNLTDVVIDPKERDVALVMDFAAWTLKSTLKEHRRQQQRISEYSCKAMMYQCLSGLKYLHENWVLHRDLKPENILIIGDGEKRGQLQLADMGLARIFKSPIRCLGSVDPAVVTLWYRAPELLLGATHYTTAVDIWSLGCIFAELFFAHSPTGPPALFPGKQLSEPNKHVFEKDQSKRVFAVLGMPSWPNIEKLQEYEKLMELKEEEPQCFPASSQLAAQMNRYSGGGGAKAAIDLLSQMLELEPGKRISAQECLRHGYFDSFLKRFPENVRRNALDDPSDPDRRRLHYQLNPPDPLDGQVRKAQTQYRQSKWNSSSNANDNRKRGRHHV